MAGILLWCPSCGADDWLVLAPDRTELPTCPTCGDMLEPAEAWLSLQEIERRAGKYGRLDRDL